MQQNSWASPVIPISLTEPLSTQVLELKARSYSSLPLRFNPSASHFDSTFTTHSKSISFFTATPQFQATIISNLDYCNSHSTSLSSSILAPIESTLHNSQNAFWKALSQILSLFCSKPSGGFLPCFEQNSNCLSPKYGPYPSLSTPTALVLSITITLAFYCSLNTSSSLLRAFSTCGSLWLKCSLPQDFLMAGSFSFFMWLREAFSEH